MNWLALSCAWRWKASAIPFDCPTERYRDWYARPPGARRVEHVTELAFAPSHRTRPCTGLAPRRFERCGRVVMHSAHQVRGSYGRMCSSIDFFLTVCGAI